MRLRDFSILALIAATSMPTFAASERGQVVIYNWPGFIEPNVVEKFEARSGLDVVVDSYEDANAAEARLLARGTGYDLAIVSSESFGRIVASGALQKLDQDKILDVAEQKPFLMNKLRHAMPDMNDYALPYMWGTTGLAYNTDAVAARIPNAPTDSWALLFDPRNAAKMADCGITIVDSNEEVIAAALAYLGKDPRSQSAEDLDAAFEVLSAIAPYVRSYDNEQYDDLLSDEVCLTLTWSSEGFAPLIEGEGGYDYVIPKEGSNLWADLFVIPVDAGAPSAAAEVINHVMQEDNLAASVEFNFGVVSSDAVAAIIEAPEFRHPALRLSADVQKRLYWAPQYTGKQKQLLDDRWLNLQLGL